MSLLDTMLNGAGTVAILGHVRPDGDCVGSCLAALNYIKENYSEKHATVYLEKPSSKFSYLEGFEEICSEFDGEQVYDLCLCLDSSDTLRFGSAVKYLETAVHSLCVDHHVTNLQYAEENVVEAGASSTCEVLYGLFDENRISKAVAACIYTGIIHDTGVFKYECTSEKTMIIAGKLMAAGIPFSRIIDDSFYRKNYVQNQILGRALLESVTFLDGRCIFTVIYKKDMEFYGVTSKDLDGIIDQLRITEGVECAIFLSETASQEYKVSMRSTSYIDVSKIALMFGGGGHIKAAGCTMNGSIHDVINNLSAQIARQMKLRGED